MSSSLPHELGFKRISLENWLSVDPAWNGVAMSSSMPDPSQAWVFDLVRNELNAVVPLPVRKLFDVARGTLVYSLMFYPLLTLGSEQMFRVFDVAAAEKCKELNAPAKVKVFADKIAWLTKHGAIGPHEVHRWQAFRHLRNMASHPSDQSIMSPAEALLIVDIALELIDRLFATNGENGS